MKNLDIREALKNANMRHWVLANELGISESTLTHWLRHELPTDKKKEIKKIIKSYKASIDHTKNLDIREALKNANMCHWVLADELGINCSTLSCWLRHELPTGKKEEIMKIIESYKPSVQSSQEKEVVK